MAAVGVSVGHVLAYSSALLLHGLRVRGDQQGRGGGGFEPGIQGIPPGRLFQLASEAR